MSVVFHRPVAEADDRECPNGDTRATVRRLNEVIAEVKQRVLEAGARGDSKAERYSYVLLWYILDDVKSELLKRGVISPLNTFILPGALYIAKSLIDGTITVDEAAAVVQSVRARVKKFVRVLAYEKNLELLLPENVEANTLKIFAWVDYVGKDRGGDDMYVLTLYFSFPFDIHRKDMRSEYEPVSFLFVKRGKEYVPIRAFARVHYNIYAYDIEKQERVRVLFTKHGHTPVVLDASASPVDSGFPKVVLDLVWVRLGSFITRVSGVRSVKLKELRENAHLYTYHRLEKSKNNPFVSKVHPYFVCLKLS